jgi:hypothetical protein
MRKIGFNYILLILLAAVSLIGCSKSTTDDGTRGLVISEVVSSNRFSLNDDTFGSPDWVELYNGSNEDIDLSGYGFSDNLRNLHKFVFGDVTIPAGGYIVLFLSNAEGVEHSDSLVAGFGLSKSGENLFLTDPYYGFVQELTLPALPTDIAYARRADGSYGFTMVTTPNGSPETVFDSLSDIYNLPEKSLIISEILPYPDGGEAWVELYNASDEAIRLENFYISDNPAVLKRFLLPSGTLEAGAYLVCSLSGASEKGAPDITVQADFRIGRDDTAIYLADASGAVVDFLTWPESLAVGLSVLSDKEFCAYPTPAAANSTLFSTVPNVQEEDAADALCISEALPNNLYTLSDQDGDRSDWVELYNCSADAVSLGSYFLSDDSDAPFRYALPDQMLATGDYIVVFLSGKDRVKDGEIHASFSLGADETALYLTNAVSFTRETLALAPDCPADISIGHANDGSMVFYAFPTPWYENAAPFSILADAYHSIADVTINEVFSGAVYGDDTPDWIELKNNTDEPVSLKDWYLSDSLSMLKRWQLPDTVVPPNGYTVIYTTNEAVEDATATASFSIAASGETIFLSDTNGSRVDSLETGAIRAGNSAGREQAPEMQRVFYTIPTPGEPNEGEYSTGYAPKPFFSENTLLHTEPFTLSLRSSNPNAAIYYTTDGSNPTEKSARYAEPISIDHNTVIRAASFQSGLMRSDIETRTFLFNAKHELPILCLTTSPENLVGRDGIMANKNLYNYEWERAAVIEYHDGESRFSVNCGIQLHGNMTRQVNGYGKPSMKLSFRASYNNAILNYPLFEDGKTTIFHDLLLRNGSDMRLAVIRDELITNIAYRASDQLCVMTAQYVAAYFNGEYMGLYAVKESIGSGYFAEHFGVSQESVEMHRPYREESKDFVALMRYAKEHDLRNEEHYRYLEARIDFSSMIDWLIFEAYSANRDLGMNVRYYRSMEGDGKWHYALFDLDLSMKTDAGLEALTDGAWNIIPRKLLENETFQDLFLKRLAYLLEHELSQESVLTEFDSLVDQIDEEMVLERARWPKSVNKTWEGYALDVKVEIMKDRAEQLRVSIAAYMGRPLSEIEAYFTQD